MNHEHSSPGPLPAVGLLRKIGARVHDIVRPDVETRRERENRSFLKAIERGNFILVPSSEAGPISAEHLARLRPASSGGTTEQTDD